MPAAAIMGGVSPRNLGKLNESARPLVSSRSMLEAEVDRAYAAGDLDATVKAAKRLVNLVPEHARARLLLGVVAWRRGDTSTGLQQVGRAVAADPQNLEAWRVLGRVANEAGELAVAEAAYREACRVEPGPKSDGDLALQLCYAGRWAEGWALAETRCQGELQKNDLLHRDLDRDPRPYWDGAAFDGTLLVVHEGGFGDTIQFARYLREARSFCSRLVLKAPVQLERLLGGLEFFTLTPPTSPMLEIDAVRKTVPAFDRWCFTMSLPHLLGRPEPIALQYYLGCEEYQPPTEIVNSKPRVGLVWGGSPIAARDALRSLPVGHVADLVAATPDVEWHALQQGPHRSKMGEVRRQLVRRGASPDLFVHEYDVEDFADTAALALAMDLVVTVDTSTAHLCGALGVETWVALSTCPDYRYGTGSTRSAWYASQRLFRQPAPGRWDAVVTDIAAALKEKFA